MHRYVQLAVVVAIMVRGFNLKNLPGKTRGCCDELLVLNKCMAVSAKRKYGPCGPLKCSRKNGTSSSRRWIEK